jgi:DNA topoisomerase-2
MEAYVALFGFDKDAVIMRTVQDGGETLRFAVGLSKSESFQHDSCVNGISTLSGGTHVTVVSNAVIDTLTKKTGATAQQVRSSLFIVSFFTSTLPKFNAQIKTELTSKINKALADKVSNEIDAAFKKSDPTGLVAFITKKTKLLSHLSTMKEMGGDTKKTRVDVPDLMVRSYLTLHSLTLAQDAPRAGKKGCDQALLFITEGASALSMCVEGFAVVGTDLYGAIPIRGKITNVNQMGLDAVIEKIPAVNAIAKALGLRPGCSKPYPVYR